MSQSQIVQEEETQLIEVQRRLRAGPPPETMDENHLIEEVERLREEMLGAKNQDRPAIEQQFEHVGRLLEQIRKGKSGGMVS